MLPMSDFDDNHRPYGIKSRKGKMFSCKQCTINWTVKNLKAGDVISGDTGWQAIISLYNVTT